MDQERFDQITRALAAGTSRRAMLRRLGGVLGGVLGLGASGSLAAPPASKPSKCYGGGSSCTNGKQCCSGTCTNRQCAPEVPPTFCVAGTTRACYSGPANTVGVGVCRAGLETCLPDGSGYGSCVGEVKPSAEVCDGRDNDCDGAVDEGNPGAGASCNTGLLGICATGTTACVGGSLICQQNQQPRAEICGNGLDDDCDGTVDDGCPTQCPEGYESNGTACVDIDECERGTALCDPVASCSNTEGGYDCECPPGYIGNGRVCFEI